MAREGGNGPARILVGYDGSEDSLDALALGALLARSLDGEIVLAAAFPRIAQTGDFQSYEVALGRESGPLFGGALERLAASDRERVANRRAIGGRVAPDALRHLATGELSDLVVVGSTHRGPIGRVVPGSVAERLVRTCPVPVAVAPRGYLDHAPDRVEVVGVAFDASAEAERALGAACSLVQAVDGRLLVLGVAEPVAVGEIPYSDLRPERPDPHFSPTALASALDDAIASLPAGLEVARRVLSGRPAEALAGIGSEAADVMVLGSHGRGPLLRLLLGSVSGELADAPSWPLIVVSPGADIALGGEERAERRRGPARRRIAALTARRG